MHPIRETLADLAIRHPGAKRVFLRHGLDFCCGGQMMLEEACRRSGLDPARIWDEIEAEDARGEISSERWDERPLADLVRHILTRYHEPLRRDFPGLIQAARRVEEVHKEKPACPRGLADLLLHRSEAVEEPLTKEERILFPTIVSGGGRHAHMPVSVLVQEHQDHGANLRRIREVTSDHELPEEACRTWRGLYEELRRLEAETMDPIHLENNILFPRALRESEEDSRDPIGRTRRGGKTMNRKRRMVALVVSAAFGLLLDALTADVLAHCDTLDGPVVTAARRAVAAGDVTPVLAWVRPQDEAKIRDAFPRTLEVRGLGEAARELADRYVFETVVRIHREGEGAPDTGLKPAGEVEPVIAMADAALESGSVDELAESVSAAAAGGIRERFEKAVAASRRAGRSVAAGREFVAAYVTFIHYVEALHETIGSGAAHH